MRRLFSSPLLLKVKKVVNPFLKKGKAQLLFYPAFVGVILCVFLVPLLLVFKTAKNKYDLLCQAECLIDSLESKARKTKQLRQKESQFIESLHGANKDFLSQVVAGEEFLLDEKDSIQTLLSHKELSQSQTLLERLGILKKNHVDLQEVSTFEKKGIAEVSYSLGEKIELSGKDIQKLLLMIESSSEYKNKPQLLFKHFSIQRNPLSNGYETFSCNFSLLERIKK